MSRRKFDSPNMPQAVLVVDDEANMQHMLTALLSKHGYRVDVASDGTRAIELMHRSRYDFVLCDVRMPVLDGMEFLQQVQKNGWASTVIMMSAYGTLDLAIETVKQGAYDYISKPFKLEEILLVLRKAEERERLRHENRQLKAHLDAIECQRSFGDMVGKSKAMQDIFQLAGKVAQHSTTVLITGESGTGKELVAKGIHKASAREHQPFVAVNCGSIPENLLESEFFGYARGAFTGADREKKGLFEEANNGTIFLDEIGELPLGLQVKMLRVLQEGEVRRIGALKSQQVDVRVLAATNKNLVDLVDRALFREDLFYRLNVLNIHLPPLRERREDIPLLCHIILHKCSARLGREVQDIAPSAMELLIRYDWPGNVRELENIVERALIIADRNVILPQNLPEQLGGCEERRRIDDLLGTYSLKKAKSIMEKRLIGRAMEATGGNKSKAAQLLELSYPALLAKLKEYEW